MSLTATTKLEAINVLLASIGEAPVNSEGSGLDEEALASGLINETSRAVQVRGWSWNVEDNYPLSRNEDGEIPLPYNTLKVDFQSPRYVARGRRVYDKHKHSYKHSTDLKATITVGLDWEELPEAVRTYVTYRAGRVFQARQVGSTVLHEFTQQDEATAWNELVSADLEVASLSMFHNPELQLMLDRRSSVAVIDYPAGALGGNRYV